MVAKFQSEAQLHTSIAGTLTYAFGPGVWWTTFPAGGGGKARGAQLKGRGLKAGVPDILIVYEGKLHGIELKIARGVVSPEQSRCHDAMEAAGAEILVCRNFEDVAAALGVWGIPFRANVF